MNGPTALVFATQPDEHRRQSHAPPTLLQPAAIGSTTKDRSSSSPEKRANRSGRVSDLDRPSSGAHTLQFSQRTPRRPIPPRYRRVQLWSPALLLSDMPALPLGGSANPCSQRGESATPARMSATASGLLF